MRVIMVRKSEKTMPMYWKDEVGQLPAAITAYVNHMAEPSRFAAPREDQIMLVIAYLRQWVNATIWVEIDGELAKVRNVASKASTLADAVNVIRLCVEFGIDPL